MKTAEQFKDDVMDSIYMNGGKEDGKYILTLEELENAATEILKLSDDRTREAIKADRENVAKHATTKNLYEPRCSDHTPYWGACVTCGSISNPDELVGAIVDEDSIINAPEIPLL